MCRTSAGCCVATAASGRRASMLGASALASNNTTATAVPCSAADAANCVSTPNRWWGSCGVGAEVSRCNTPGSLASRMPPEVGPCLEHSREGLWKFPQSSENSPRRSIGTGADAKHRGRFHAFTTATSASGWTNSRSGCRTVSTGQGANRTTRSATLPISRCANAPRPCVPITIASMAWLFA